MDFAQTTAYDPVRKQLVRVPESQAEMLKEAGYSIGEQAHIRANADGWDGTAKAAAASFLNGATAGMSDYAMPASVAQAAKVAEEAHPIVSGLAKVGGIATGLAATGGLAPEFAIGARVLHGAAAGAMDEINRAKMAGEPIQWERVRSGLTIGGIFNAIAEGAPVAISALGKKSMKTLLNVWPKEASAEEAATFAKPFGEETAPVYKRMLNEEHAHAAEIGGSLIGGAKGYAATKSIFAADRIITHSLNNLNRATDALDSISEGPMKAMEGTLKSLLNPKP